MNLRFRNLLTEAMHAQESGHDAKALELVDEARLALLPPRGAGVRPEDDPQRSAIDRAAWRAARGEG